MIFLTVIISIIILFWGIDSSNSYDAPRNQYYTIRRRGFIEKLIDRIVNSNNCECYYKLPNPEGIGVELDYFKSPYSMWKQTGMHDKWYKCPKCGKIHLSKREPRDKCGWLISGEIWTSNIEIVEEDLIKKLDKYAHDMYMLHLKNYNPNMYNKLTSNPHRYTKEEEDKIIERSGKFCLH